LFYKIKREKDGEVPSVEENKSIAMGQKRGR